MSNISLLFADETELTVEQVAVPLAVTVLCKDFTTLAEAWEIFLDTEKTSTMKVTVDGETTANYGNVTLDTVQTIYNNDGSMTAHFYLNYAESDDISDTEALQIIMGEIE